MNVFDRGIQLYLLSLFVIGTIVAVWGTNRFVLDNTTAETGWAMLVAIALALVALGLAVRYFRPSTDQRPDTVPW